MKKNIKKILDAGEGSGRSGNFFFYTFDRKFVIKTLTNEDKASLMSCLEDYLKYLRSNKNSLLSRYYGVFEVVTRVFKPIYIVLMNNIKPLQDP